LGLWNVAAACHNDPRGEPAWPAITTEFATSLLEDIDRNPLDRLTPAEARYRVYVKLFPGGGANPAHTETLSGHHRTVRSLIGQGRGSRKGPEAAGIAC
jgi:hypothetical protein